MTALRPYNSAERKEMPVWEILANYFPDAFAALARHSKKANDKHNPGEPMHWARNKSTDHLNCAVRHLMTPDNVDADTGEIELVGAFWRCAAALQLREERRLWNLGILPLSGQEPGIVAGIDLRTPGVRDEAAQGGHYIGLDRNPATCPECGRAPHAGNCGFFNPE